MRFAQPVFLWLALPCVVAWAVLLRLQLAALREVEAHVGRRFRSAVTRHSRRSLRAHLMLLLLMASLLIAAGSGPSLPVGGSTTETPARVLLLIDASASMYADDIGEQLLALPEEGISEPPERRLDLARRLALELVRGLDDPQVALASFSGRTTLHLPMTGRLDQIEAALFTLESHNYYRNTGSSLSGALAETFHFIDPSRPGLQVVLIGDGELPFDEDYGEPVAALAEQGVAVHGLTVGSLEGQARVIYDFDDIVAKVEKPRVLRNYTTRRVDEHYERIAAATNGRFMVAGAGAVESLSAAIGDYRAPIDKDDPRAARRDLAPLLLLLFLLAFLVEALVIGRRSGAPEFRFEIERLGRSAGVVLVGTVALAVSALTGCGDSTLERAHHANELGITEDAARSFGPARTSFERSIGFGEQAEIPTYNLGRTLIRAGSFSEAHEVLQRALELDPELIAAYFNDGIALYRLGREERDPRDCDLRRTRDLWLAARDRFELTIERAGENAALTEAGRANLTAMRAALTELERLIADPPPECLQSSADASAGGGSGGGGGGGGSTPELPPGAAAGGGRRQSPEPLSASEHESVNEALDRIARQRMEDGKYHRRTLAEQFPPSAWANPDPEIWW